MPKEAKKRGRRAEKQRRQAQAQAQAEAQAEVEADAIPEEASYPDGGGGEEGYAEGFEQEEQFYGLLTEQEQEYFRQADGVLDSNAFSSAEGFHFPFLSSMHFPKGCGKLID
jgi:nucleolar protein 9